MYSATRLHPLVRTSPARVCGRPRTRIQPVPRLSASPPRDRRGGACHCGRLLPPRQFRRRPLCEDHGAAFWRTPAGSAEEASCSVPYEFGAESYGPRSTSRASPAKEASGSSPPQRGSRPLFPEAEKPPRTTVDVPGICPSAASPGTAAASPLTPCGPASEMGQPFESALVWRTLTKVATPEESSMPRDGSTKPRLD